MRHYSHSCRHIEPAPKLATLFFVAVALAGAACSDSSSTSADATTSTDGQAATDGGAAEAGGDVGVDAPAALCQAVEPPCQDQQIQQLDLFDKASNRTVTEEGKTSGEFTTLIDATGGGFNPTEAFVYVRFTDSGLEVVKLDDEAALLSTDWDLAARRYILRLNSGVAGASCVVGARTAPGTTFESLTSVPGSLSFKEEQYFTSTCDFVPDTSGIGAPSTVLGSYWEYPGCVKMTGNVYVVKLANGRHVKLQVLSFYSPDVQKQCNSTGSTSQPSGSGQVRIRWAFL